MRKRLPSALLLCLVAACAWPKKTAIATDLAPAAIGPYSQAIQAGPMLFCSGQIAIDPATGNMVEGGIEAETERVLANIEAVLHAGGCTFDDVVLAQVFLADMSDYATMNRIYATRFQRVPPARAAVQVARLPRDARVEIMVMALRGCH